LLGYSEYTNIYPITTVAKNVNSNTCGTCAITQEKIDKYNEYKKSKMMDGVNFYVNFGYTLGLLGHYKEQ